jgi:glutamine synthetase type III
MLENNSKSMWLAVSLAVITSVTSLGTAFISKDTSSSKELSEKVSTLEEELKELKSINEKLHGLVVMANDKVDNCKCR